MNDYKTQTKKAVELLRIALAHLEAEQDASEGECDRLNRADPFISAALSLTERR